MSDEQDMRTVAHLDVRRADHDTRAFATRIVALLNSPEPVLLDLRHDDHGDQIRLRCGECP